MISKYCCANRLLSCLLRYVVAGLGQTAVTDLTQAVNCCRSDGDCHAEVSVAGNRHADDLPGVSCNGWASGSPALVRGHLVEHARVLVRFSREPVACRGAALTSIDAALSPHRRPRPDASQSLVPAQRCEAAWIVPWSRGASPQRKPVPPGLLRPNLLPPWVWRLRCVCLCGRRGRRRSRPSGRSFADYLVIATGNRGAVSGAAVVPPLPAGSFDGLDVVAGGRWTGGGRPADVGAGPGRGAACNW